MPEELKKGTFLLVLRDLVEVFTSKLYLISYPSNDLLLTDVSGIDYITNAQSVR